MRYLFLIGFLFSACSLVAQEKIETDRPDQTETAILIDKHTLQVEMGFNKENEKNEHFTLVHPTTLLKYGLAKRIELRLEVNYKTTHQQLIPEPKETTLFEPLVPGVKIALFEEKGLRPKTSFIGGMSLPFSGSRIARTTNMAPGFRFTIQHTLSKAAALGYNIGAEWDGENSPPEWIYTFAPGISVGEKWYVYVEAFGAIQKGNSPDHNIDGGLAYFISNDVKVDLSGGIGLSENSLKNYVALGLSFRFHLKKEQAPTE